MKKLILASNSPRRKELLKLHNFIFTIIPSNFDETTISKCSPSEYVKQLSKGKAQDVFNSLKNKEEYTVLGADTIVYFNNKILGKPKDEIEAFNMLSELSNKTHEVYTGWTIINSEKIITNYTLSKVTFNKLDERLIKDYINSKLPLDKAGSYGIQDGFPIVKNYSGSFENIIGLPVDEIKDIIEKMLS